MPELPEVEVLVRHLQPLVRGRRITSVDVRRARVIRPTSPRALQRLLLGARIKDVRRRGKYLLFEVRPRGRAVARVLVGHLGMTGRMYLLPATADLPKHAAVVLGLGREKFVFEDTRYFGRLTADIDAVRDLGPEPLGEEFTVEGFSALLRRSAQPIKVKLLDQGLVAGIGNIYASEALFRARVSPNSPANRVKQDQLRRLWLSIRETLAEAIRFGSTVSLNFGEKRRTDGIFYYGSAPENSRFYEERLRVYDREGEPCLQCGAKIRRIVQAGRSTFFCAQCQPRQ